MRNVSVIIWAASAILCLTCALKGGGLIDNDLGIGYDTSIVTLSERDYFEDPNSWDVFDAEVELDPNLKSYVRGTFDGQYVYFAPYDPSSNRGNALRYDTNGDFYDVNSWEYYAPCDDLPDCDSGKYISATFDGRYVYYSPSSTASGTASHGLMLRYDTNSNFSDPNAWACFDPGEAKGDTDLVGFGDCVFDDHQYVYFVPHNDQPKTKVLRYDTTSDFNDESSWESYDLQPVIGSTGHYPGCTFDGQYLYLANFRKAGVRSGTMLRYDTSKDFNDKNSWEEYDAQTSKGFAGGIGAIFDDIHQYVYFVPYFGSGSEGSILRYKVNEVFDNSALWQVFDAKNTVGSDPRGYYEGVFDGKYIYFTPRYDLGIYAEVLRYDTTKAFLDPLSWKAYHPPIIADGGYIGAIYDERYIYFVPWKNYSDGYHGKVLRLDTEYGYVGTCWDLDECAGQPFGDATCDGDVNVGAVNLGDLLALKKSWGASGPPWINSYCCADFNHDGAVNLGDLLILKENWGRDGFTPSTGNQTCPE